MTENRTYDEERIADLLAALPPAPEGWVQAAQELPAARREMDEIVARAQADQRFREAAIADLESALAAAGYDVDHRLLPALRQRLTAE
jgi:regulator of protease activity HflC (stomatin/prohibitin superfamily)